MRKNKKGFTLAELLIVVAIIAVLTAIAIPVFTSQLEKSRDAVTLSNVRSAYAMAQSAWLTNSSDAANGVTVNKTSGAAGTVTALGSSAVRSYWCPTSREHEAHEHYESNKQCDGPNLFHDFFLLAYFVKF